MHLFQLSRIKAEKERLLLKQDQKPGERSIDVPQSLDLTNGAHSQQATELARLRLQVQELALQRSVEVNDYEDEIARLRAENKSLQLELKSVTCLAEDLQQQQFSTPVKSQEHNRLTDAFPSPCASPIGIGPESGVFPSPSLSAIGGATRRSIWTEFESQYDLLQKNYEQMKQRCRCGAANGSLSLPPPSLALREDAMMSLSPKGSGSHHQLFNDLFDMLHRFKTELHN